MIVALLLAAAQASAPAPAAPTTVAPAAHLSLDTPVQLIAADARGKAVLDADLPQLTAHPMYDSFKALTLRQLQGYAPDQLSDAVLAKVGADLAKVK